MLPKLILLAVVGAGTGFLATVGTEVRSILGDLVARSAQGRIVDVACAVEFEAYEVPAFHDRLMRASREGQYKPMMMVEGLLGLVGSGVRVVGLVTALFVIRPWLVPLVLFAGVPLLVSEAKGEVLFGFPLRDDPGRPGAQLPLQPLDRQGASTIP